MTGIGRRGRVPECRRMRLYAVALKGGAGGGGGVVVVVRVIVIGHGRVDSGSTVPGSSTGKGGYCWLSSSE